jgi:hypothetical protein
VSRYRHGAKGLHVEEVQADLERMNYPLPKFGRDGSLGNETWRALEMFAVDTGWPLGEDEGLDEVDDVEGLVDRLRQFADLERSWKLEDVDVHVQDVTGVYTKVIKGLRSWKQINAIVLHQTGTARLSSDPRHWVHIPAHLGIPQVGSEVFLLHPLVAYLYHANSFNRRSIGIEVGGNHLGIEGDTHTHWKPGGGPNTATDGQIAATRKAIQWVCRQAKANGGEITHIFAHRQSNGIKLADPGERIWSECGFWALQELGLSDGGPGYKSGKGKPIPYEWVNEESYKGYTYW